MSVNLPALKILTPRETLTIARGSCVRHRYGPSECSGCIDVCPAAALLWREEGLVWDEALCRGCLLCSSACPSGAIEASEFSLLSLLHNLKGAEAPVIACREDSALKGHARVPCLGFLADHEILLTLVLALGKKVGLNLSMCRDCRNGAVVESLQGAVEKLAALNLDIDAIELLFAADDIGFREQSVSRREFFSLLKARSTRAGFGIVDRLKPPETSGRYGKKHLPESRHLLLQALAADPIAGAQTKLFPQRTLSEDCRECTGCVGLCPTGALQPPPEQGMQPEFEARYCSGCGICEKFCSASAIRIAMGMDKSQSKANLS